MKNFKNLMFIVAVLCLCCGLLAGCGGAAQEAEDDSLSAKYPLESEKVVIYMIPGDGTVNSIEITDGADIKILQESVDFSSWQQVSAEDAYAGMTYYYINFNDSTTIAMYEDVPFGFIGSGIPDGNGNLSEGDSMGNMKMSESFLQTVLQMVDKYAK